MHLNLNTYLDSLKGKRVAVIGIGVSNTPLIELLLGYGISVTACDQKERSAFGTLADRLEKWGCQLKLGEDYLKNLDQDVIFRPPASGRTSQSFWKQNRAAAKLLLKWKCFLRSVLVILLQ